MIKKLTEADKLQFIQDDMLLMARLRGTLNIGIGDYGITVISCKPTDDFRIIAEGEHKGYYINIKTQVCSGGYNISLMKEGQSELHICPAVVNASLPEFHAITAHEFVHCLHNRMIRNHSELYSERAAYLLQYNVFMFYNLPDRAEGTKRIAEAIIYDGLSAWGEYPKEYCINDLIESYEAMKKATDGLKEMIFNAMKNNQINFIN